MPARPGSATDPGREDGGATPSISRTRRRASLTRRPGPRVTGRLTARRAVGSAAAIGTVGGPNGRTAAVSIITRTGCSHRGAPPDILVLTWADIARLVPFGRAPRSPSAYDDCPGRACATPRGGTNKQKRDKEPRQQEERPWAESAPSREPEMESPKEKKKERQVEPYLLRPNLLPGLA